MPRISLWKPDQREDYNFIDRTAREHFDLGATGVYVHKYIGPGDSLDDEESTSTSNEDIDELSIGDVLFLENRSRKYDTDIYELRGSYAPADTDLDLTQFGIFLADDTIRIVFHLNDMVDKLGRKLMAGDVLELPHLREYFGLDEDKKAINRFYVVEDGSYPSEGYGPRWWNHMWRVNAKMITDSPEFEDILNRVINEDGTTSVADGDDCCDVTIRDVLSQASRDQEITDAIIERAEKDVEYDSLWYRAEHLYVGKDENGNPNLIAWKTGDGVPPDGVPIAGRGDSFPETMVIGDYFLRTDFVPPVLYQKQTNCKFAKIETDQRKLPWTGANRVIDSFLENNKEVINDDGTVVSSRQALSKLIKPKPQDLVKGVLTAPQNFTAIGANDTPSVTLSWKSNVIGEGFKIYRASDVESLLQETEPYATISITLNTFEDTNTESGTLYFYRISAFEGNRELFSQPANAVTADEPIIDESDQFVQDDDDNFITDNE